MFIKLTERISEPPKVFWVSYVYLIRINPNDGTCDDGTVWHCTEVVIAKPQYSETVLVRETPEQILELINEARKES